MGRMAGTCGAVTGAFMALGLRFGGTTPDREAKERVYEKVREFADRFKARNGSLLCRDLLTCDVSTAEGYEAAKERGLFATTAQNICETPPRSWRKCWRGEGRLYVNLPASPLAPHSSRSC